MRQSWKRPNEQLCARIEKALLTEKSDPTLPTEPTERMLPVEATPPKQPSDRSPKTQSALRTLHADTREYRARCTPECSAPLSEQVGVGIV